MVLNKENITNGLREANLLRNENYYFTSFVLPTMEQYVILGVFAGVLNDFSGYVINTTEEGIGVLPISSMSGKFAIERAVMLPYQIIMKVEVKSGGLFGYKKINIVLNNYESISFKVTKRVLTNPNHLDNVNYFLSRFNAI